MLKINVITHAFLAIFPITNPIGMSAIFLSYTQHYTSQIREKMALTITIYYLCIMSCVLLIGPAILEFFGISIPIIQLTGGLIVCHAGWEMLNAKPRISQRIIKVNANEITFYPLTMPLTAGAGSIAMAITIASTLHASLPRQTLLNYCAALLGILGVCLTIFICYRFANAIFNKLGTTGTKVVTKLSAFILLAVGSEIAWAGIKELILSLH